MFNKQTQQHNDIMLNITQHKPIHETITNVSCTCITYSQVVQHTAFTFVDLCLSYKIHAIEYLRRLTSLTKIPILSRNVSSEVYSIFLLGTVSLGISTPLGHMMVPIIGASLSELHTHQYYEKNLVPMYVCMYVYVCTTYILAIRRPCAYHACTRISMRAPQSPSG